MQISRGVEEGEAGAAEEMVDEDGEVEGGDVGGEALPRPRDHSGRRRVGLVFEEVRPAGRVAAEWLVVLGIIR
jgi:hypothetical protein